MITVVVGKEIEKLKGEFESVINGMNMVGEIPYNVYSELFDVGTDCIQKAYELGKSDLEKENAELKSENQKWKDEWQEQVQKATDEGYTRTLQTMQLSKAKEIIKIFLKYEICTLNIKDELADNITKAKAFLKSEVEK